MEDDEMWLFKSHTEQKDIDAVTEVLKRGTWFIEGPEIDALEDRITSMSDREYGSTFNSGTSALFAVFSALGVTGQEVIVPSFTYPATANAVVAAGGKPVFADIELDSLALDATDVRQKVSEDTAAIVPVHFSGDVCRDIYELQDIAEKHDVPLVEDAAHSLGASYGDDKVGSFGTAAAFSFSFNKLVTCGEGGILVTDSRSLQTEVEKVRRQGRNRQEEYVDYGYNLQMSSIEAALGLSQTMRFDEIVKERREMATYLNDRLGTVDDITVPTPTPERDRVYLFYNIRVQDRSQRDALRRHLERRDIPTEITYEPVHLKPYYRREWGCEEGDLPATERVSSRIVTLPFHLELSQDDLDTLAGHVLSFFAD